MKRSLIYVHYNHRNELDEYVINQLSRLQELYTKIIFVSNSHLDEKMIEQVEATVESELEIILRENLGYDFGAWKEALNHLDLKEFDNLTLMNDTCFGPFTSLKSFYERNEQDSTIDFFGMTHHPKFKIPGGPMVEEHLQSYFMVFKETVLEHEVFSRFWDMVQYEKDVQEVIEKYEVHLTQELKRAGFKYRSQLSLPNEINYTNANMIMERPDIVLEQGIPFLKIKAIEHQPLYATYCMKHIRSYFDYPFELMIDAISKRYSPFSTAILPFKTIIAQDFNRSNIDYALHFHLVSEEELLYIERLREFHERSIIVTTSNDKLFKRLQLSKHVIVYKTQTSVQTMALFEVFKKIKSFDYICSVSIQTGNDSHLILNENINQVFDEIFEIENYIVSIFANLPQIGLLISDMNLSNWLDDELGETQLSNYHWYSRENLMLLSDHFQESPTLNQLNEEVIAQQLIKYGKHTYFVKNPKLSIPIYFEKKLSEFEKEKRQHSYLSLTSISSVKDLMSLYLRLSKVTINYFIGKLTKTTKK